MLLQRLSEYADRLNLPPTLYSESPVRYIIELGPEGKVLSPDPVDTADPSSPRTKRGQRRLVPQVQRSSGVRPLLLADKADYVLGYAPDPARQTRVQACHQAFLAQLGRCVEITAEPTVAAVLHFLSDRPLVELRLGSDFDPSGVITFRVGGVFPVDLPAVQEFWAEENRPDSDDATVLQCLVCGREGPVLERLQGKIKGVPGGQTSGTSIISANTEAFESYGLKASLTAPTCARCGERFTKALNDLLSRPASRIVLGGSAFVFWTREPTAEFDFHGFLTDPKPEEVRLLLESVRTGSLTPRVDEDRFYATVLSGSGGRAVVRDWIDTTVVDVKAQLARWFGRQAIIGPWGEVPEPLGLYALAASTVRDPRTDLAPPTPRALLRAALAGTPVPPGLLFQAVRRNRTEQTVTRPRACLIKLVLASMIPDMKEDSMIGLDPDSPYPAYHCGRLLAVLEQVQRLAVPGIKATVVDRFFGTASSAPASVFGRLLRGAQPHLAKLERDRPGAYGALQKRLEDILAHLDGFPKTLNLEAQGLFALGYYHQRAGDRAHALAAKARGDHSDVALAEDADPAPTTVNP